MSTIVKLGKIVDYLRQNVRSELPSQQLAIILKVAEKPGITQIDLAAELRLTGGSLSRNLTTLSQYKEDGELHGFDLVQTRQSLDNRARMAVWLTEKGEKLITELRHIMETEYQPVKGEVDDRNL